MVQITPSEVFGATPFFIVHHRGRGHGYEMLARLVGESKIKTILSRFHQ